MKTIILYTNHISPICYNNKQYNMNYKMQFKCTNKYICHIYTCILFIYAHIYYILYIKAF